MCGFFLSSLKKSGWELTLPRPMFLREAELCSCGASVLVARAPSDRWDGSPAAVTVPAQPRTDKAIHTKKFTKSRENTGTITSLKKGSCCHKTQKQKTHLKPNRPHPKTFQHVPHNLKRSPYGLDSKVHGGGVSRILHLARLSGKSGAGSRVPVPFAISVARGGACPRNWGLILSGFGQSS